MNCIVVQPPSKDACGKPAEYKVTFPGENNGTAAACEGCAVFLRDTAKGFGTSVRIERLECSGG